MIVVSDTSCLSNLLSIGQESPPAALVGEVRSLRAVERGLLRFHPRRPTS